VATAEFMMVVTPVVGPAVKLNVGCGQITRGNFGISIKMHVDNSTLLSPIYALALQQLKLNCVAHSSHELIASYSTV
jgi:hypothetical protein